MDGDTCLVDICCSHCELTRRTRLRISGIESWETKGPQRDIALMAAHMLNDRFADTIGIFVPDAGQIDRYGRLIGDIEIAGILLSNHIVNLQLAWYGIHAEMPAHYDLSKIFTGGFNGTR